MKKEHLDIVWDSCSEFAKANISFGDFLEKLGLAMESASLPESRDIGKLARDIDFALDSGAPDEVIRLVDGMKKQVAAQIRPNR